MQLRKIIRYSIAVKRNTSILTLFLFLILCIKGNAQDKPAINEITYDDWYFLSPGPAYINQDGKFIAYKIENLPKNHKTLVLQNIDSSWKRTFIDAGIPIFASVGKKSICYILGQHDSLHIVNLGSRESKSIPNIKSISLINHNTWNSKPKWIAISSRSKSLILINKLTGEKFEFKDIDQMYPIEYGNDAILLLSENKISSLQLSTMKIKEITSLGDSIISISKAVQSPINHKIFTIASKKINGGIVSEIGSFDTIYKTLLTSEDLPIRTDLSKWTLNLTENDSCLNIDLVEQQQFSYSINKTTPLIIWSYQDNKLTPKNHQTPLQPTTSRWVLNTYTGKLTRLQSDTSFIIASNSKWLILSANLENGDMGKNEIQGTPHNIYITNTTTGETYDTKIPFINIAKTSNTLNKIAYFSNDYNKLFVYNLDSKSNQPVMDLSTANGKFKTDSIQEDQPILKYKLLGQSPNFDTIYISDKYDIWMIHTDNKFNPTNITGGYGNKNKIEFKFIQGEYKILQWNQLRYITGFNTITKKAGFYELSKGKEKEPKELYSGSDYITTRPIIMNDHLSVPVPVKAENTEAYLIVKGSTNEPFNLYYTKDFNQLIQVSTLNPTKKYNWITSELINWTLPNGKINQGILFKPENFDSSKKYPLIFYSYENSSDGLNAPLRPKELQGGSDLDIPTYASNGYLVFCPDMYTPVGASLVGATETVKSAITKLSQRQYIDTSKLGIQGASWGGITSEFVITQIPSIKAACIASARGNLISGFNSSAMGYPLLGAFIRGQIRMGKTLWEAPEIYIKNSAIMYADKINASVLIMHTTKDATLGFEDAKEFYNALRVLGKKVWLLEYTEYSHGVRGTAATDFSNRMRQFFDYFLMNKEAPDWISKKTLSVITKNSYETKNSSTK
ncbi:prolyl oligopeptidase family protein [Chitinophaga dinghuensis]|uniref:Prolyl oligopeptidase family protein n=1 Tax=Chitinophaga dinghuensis TaxID=1539050 RepID=A0A327W1S9_9BACT|nr:prolyl oligopeptidase family serine peptidase [Chitinophaga dinghuensis]RAJ81984.1 prolyl oligopeptidase family protein [Chitinophaga dinghuensis]